MSRIHLTDRQWAFIRPLLPPPAHTGRPRADDRRTQRRRGIRMCIPPKRRPVNWRAKRGRPVVASKDDYRLRYKVERNFAWQGNFRRLLIRWEHLFGVYRSFFTVAVLLVCLRRVCSCPLR